MNLHQLYEPEFHALLAVYSTPDSLYRALNRSDVVRQLVVQYSFGSISDKEIDTFVSELLDSYIPGQYFVNQVQLAAISVLAGSKNNAFTNTLLEQLTNLRVAGFPFFPRFANICLANQVQHSFTGNLIEFTKCIERDEEEYIASSTEPTVIDLTLANSHGVSLTGNERQACVI